MNHPKLFPLHPEAPAPEDADDVLRASSPTPEPTVVGIGASAGGLAALKTFFAHVPEDSGLAFVVVVHLSPEHESHLADLLQPYSKMPVRQVTHTTPLQPDHVYVIPPNRNLSTIDTHLRLSKLEEERSERAPIDHFFHTLSLTHDGHAIGVVLTGTGGDGTLGLQQIKGEGGLTIVQDPDEAEYDSMPRSAIATGLVDLILPLAEIPRHILEFYRTQPHLPAPDIEEQLDASERQVLQKVFAHVRARTGHDFSRYKRSTIMRRLGRRMQLRGTETLQAYLDLLRVNVEEAYALVDDLLITVTGLFRDAEVFQMLREEVIPPLFEGKGQDHPVRVWSVGCATGEEAYSLAMLLLEAAAQREDPPGLQIFASDLHERSLKHAREGFFPKTISADVSPERLDRFFVEENNGYRVRKEVRERVVFAQHNLLKDPPFSHIDLIVCRNVLIYFQRDVQQEIMALFHYALSQGGYLLLGPSESMDRTELFHVERKQFCLYRRRNVETAEERLPVFPLTPTRITEIGDRNYRRSDGTAGYGTLHQKMVERYAPPSVLLNEDYEVVHYSEHAGRYLVHPCGLPTSNVFKLVREELRIELRTALHVAKENGKGSRTKPIPVRFNGETYPVVLHVRPARVDDEAGLLLVIFDELADQSERAGVQPEDATVRELEDELAMIKKRLQTIIEEYETSQEELRASNEEMQSTNEELRSTMEELETSKEELQSINEELQSINEELQTVNQENRHKVEELSQLSADLQHLLMATDIAMLFLDRSLRIMRFTPRMGELFNVRHTDRGRPLADLTHRLAYGELQEDAKRVLDRLTPIEREVVADKGRWYLVRMMPYLSVDDHIDGVVITFVEVTTLKRTEEALRKTEERYRLLMENVEEYAIIMLDLEGTIATWNSGAERIFGYTEEEAIGLSGAIIFTEEDRARGAPEDEFAAARRDGQASDERWHVRKDGSLFWGNGVMTALYDDDGDPGAVLRGYAKVMRDNTRREESEEALRRMNETLEERVRERTQQVRSLASTLTMAEQQERRRISQILHDDLQQRLYGIQVKLSFIRKDATSDDRGRLQANAEEAYEWLGEAIGTTRQLTVDLSPPVLKGEGLTDALQWLQTQMRELHGLHVEVEAQNTFLLPDEDMRVLLFQIIRELLFNIVKHAETNHATVTLAADPSDDACLVILVTDDGRGFDVQATSRNQRDRGFGLFSVRERLGLFEGTMEIDSRPGAGTRVWVRVPITQTVK